MVQDAPAAELSPLLKRADQVMIESHRLRAEIQARLEEAAWQVEQLLRTASTSVAPARDVALASPFAGCPRDLDGPRRPLETGPHAREDADRAWRHIEATLQAASGPLDRHLVKGWG